MSEFLLPKVHIDVLITAALAWADQDGFYYRTLGRWDEQQDFRLTRANADATGWRLFKANWDVTEGIEMENGDEDAQPLPPYQFEPVPGEPDPFVVLAAASCYGYQTGGAEDYDGSEARGFIDRLTAAAVSHALGDGMPWPIESRTVFIEAAERWKDRKLEW